MNAREKYEERNYEDDPITSVIRAVRVKCLECCNWQSNEVKSCDIATCPLHPFRLGKDPFHTGRKAG